ncbi:phosphoadenosine phosphosulfate reductase family protein [Corynebacterium accolens]|uniref:phosphoadenosine phosphosulfate reductase domain-containing protein n=1 Tax=Corynebacterium accolens TaxID=38284 RepID=UPI003080844B
MKKFEPRLTKSIEGQPPSSEIRRRLKEEGRPVCIAFSGGKDCIAATLALMEEGVDVRPAHLYLIPGKEPMTALGFVEDSLNRLEDQLGVEIRRYPHPSFYRWINNLLFQTPDRVETIGAARFATPTYEDVWAAIKKDLGLDEDTWVADGVRASDSIVRRASIKKHGAMKPKNYKVSPVYDWLQGSVYDYIKLHDIDLPIDYELFDRSFDGLDYRFIKPIKDNLPDDYEQIKEWFPLIDLEILRNEL